MTLSDRILTTAGLFLLGAAGYFYFRKYYNNMETTTTTTTTAPGTDKSLPRGYRNNNPLNIRYNKANSWQGKVEPNTDGAFEQFRTMEYGYRAALYLLRKYIRKYGLNTVASLISRWAPNNENNTDGYISRVCNTTGYVPATILSPDNEDQLCNLVYAMALVENGYTPLPDMEQIRRAWAML